VSGAVPAASRGLGEVLQFDEIDPAFAQLVLGDLRLGPAQELGELHLGHVGLLPRLAQTVEEVRGSPNPYQSELVLRRILEGSESA